MPRASTTERGYGADHRRTRDDWAPLVNAGLVTCWRCSKLIQPGSPWDLGHDDEDRTIYRGPEHPRCNRRAGAKSPKRKHGATWRPRPPLFRADQW